MEKYLQELEQFKINELKSLLNEKEKTEQYLEKCNNLITVRNDSLKELQGYSPSEVVDSDLENKKYREFSELLNETELRNDGNAKNCAKCDSDVSVS